MNWSAVANVYEPLKAGSIDATDTIPHDHAIVRALNSTYRPNKDVKGEPKHTLFVGRLNLNTTEDTLDSIFSEHGDIVRLRLVRDIVTGFSRGYAFVEMGSARAAERACSRCNKMVIDDAEIFVDFECERMLPGWIPRRLGGGIGGKKESGQLRFGGIDRPFRKPVELMARKHQPFEKKREFTSRNSYSADHKEQRHRESHSHSNFRRRSDSRDRRRSQSRNRDRKRSRSRDRKRRRSRSKDSYRSESTKRDY